MLWPQKNKMVAQLQFPPGEIIATLLGGGEGEGTAAGHLRTFKDNFESLSRICFLIDRMDTIADRFYRVKLVHMLYRISFLSALYNKPLDNA